MFLGRRDNVTESRDGFEKVAEALTEANRNGEHPRFDKFRDSVAEQSGVCPRLAEEALWSLINRGAISLGVDFGITLNRPIETPAIRWVNPLDLISPGFPLRW